jgi:release factor glutamine methyltransferase
VDERGSDSPSFSSPQIPLCEREAKWKSLYSEVHSFYDEALCSIRDDLKGTLSVDGGPSTSDLELELEYLMEDTIVSWNNKGLSVCDEKDRDGNGPTKGEYKMRMSMGRLKELWDLRITQRVPLQYLTHSSFWRDMVLSVGNGVLIPRPETELIVEFVEKAVEENPELGRGEWADLGTGSGALAVALARALPNVERVYAADISPTPLEYVAYNASRYGVEGRILPVQSNWFEGLRQLGASNLSGIVSNPPYIPKFTCTTLQAEVKNHEPSLALDGGDDLGVDSLLPICSGASDMLRPGGFLTLETNGGDQARWVADALQAPGTFERVTIRQDLRGVDRFVTCIRTGQRLNG